MTKTTRARYTLEYKQEAVRLIEGVQSPPRLCVNITLIELNCVFTPNSNAMNCNAFGTSRW